MEQDLYPPLPLGVELSEQEKDDRRFTAILMEFPAQFFLKPEFSVRNGDFVHRNPFIKIRLTGTDPERRCLPNGGVQVPSQDASITGPSTKPGDEKPPLSEVSVKVFDPYRHGISVCTDSVEFLYFLFRNKKV